jgi:hypothetical protein
MSVKHACEKAGGTFESQGRCVCPAGLRSSWDAARTLLFCTEIDSVGIAESTATVTEEPSFVDQVTSCESPMLTIGVVAAVLLTVAVSMCCCCACLLVYVKKYRQLKL